MLLHTRSLVGSIIDTRESSFRKRQGLVFRTQHYGHARAQKVLGFGSDLDHQKLGRKGTRTMTTKATRRHRKQSNLAIKRARKDKRRKARKAAK